MSFIPYEHFVINTSLSPEEAASHISEHLKLEGSGKFTGSVNNNGFKIHRQIWYLNSSLPIIYGRFHTKEHGVQIDIKMTLMLYSVAFIIIWSFISLYVIVRSIIEWKSVGRLGSSFLFGLAMIPFMYFITMLGWMFEAGHARRFIEAMIPRQRVV